MTRISLSTHVLDTAAGAPVAAVPVTLSHGAGGVWTTLSAATTDDDGRVAELVPAGTTLPGGRYRVVFDLEAAETIASTWYPEVSIVVDLEADGGHAHIPLLLAPYGYTTYRGS